MKKKLIYVTTVIVLLVLCSAFLIACTPSATSLEKKYKDAGYTVVNGVKNDSEGAMVCSKGSDTVTITYYADKDKAKEDYTKALDAAVALKTAKEKLTFEAGKVGADEAKIKELQKTFDKAVAVAKKEVKKTFKLKGNATALASSEAAIKMF